jgi:hypothetical protein
VGLKSKRPKSNSVTEAHCAALILVLAAARSVRRSETRSNLLMLLGPNFAVFSEFLLIAKENCSVLETGALAIELHSYIKDLAVAGPLMLPSLLSVI